MAQTTIKKNAKGYGYTYTDLAQIHEQLEVLGWKYYQYIERIETEDYIYTVPIIDGKELPPRRGCKIIETSPGGKSNPAQAYGSGLTYARRYSLLMAFGFATSDDDAQTLDGMAKKATKRTYKAPETVAADDYATNEEKQALIDECKIYGLNPMQLLTEAGMPRGGRATREHVNRALILVGERSGL